MSKNKNVELDKQHGNSTKIKAFEPTTVVFGTILAILSAIICMQIIGKVGVSANTSILGAIFAMVLAKLPIEIFSKFKSLERQNYVQTVVSGAGFSASNCALTAIAILFVMGEVDAIMPMAVGCLFGTVVSIFVVGKLYDSKIFPANEAWPPGVATADILIAGDEGGDKAKRVFQGVVVGIIGSWLKFPVGAVGVVFIASLPAMMALGIGLLIRGYSLPIAGFDIAATNIPQGIMIGAGLVALIQSIIIIVKSSNKDKKEVKEKSDNYTVTDVEAKKTILFSFAIHAIGAVFIGVICGVLMEMDTPVFIAWVLWTSFASVASMMLVGMAAMYSGWFPAFAITTIFMTIGVVIGFPPLAMAVLSGYICSVGPCFADMGYDLKTGWIIRGSGVNKAHEVYGRRQQVNIEIYGAIIGIIIVIFSASMMFNNGLIPPSSKVFATTISAGSSIDIVKSLSIWAIPGAIIQLIGGSKMIGVLFATGLLINNPIYGIGVVVSVVIRLIIGDEFMHIRDAGLIAGDGLYGFFSALLKMF